MRAGARLTWGLRRLPLLAWVGVLAAVLIGATAAFGGFAPAPDRGRPTAAGEEIHLQRWRVHVDQASLVDETYQERDPRIRLAVRLEFTGHQTECCISEQMIEVRYAGRAVDNPLTASGQLRSIINFDPDVPVTHVLDFRLEPTDLPTPVPDRVEVVVRDERPTRSPVWKAWVADQAVASVDLPCPDLRSRR